MNVAPSAEQQRVIDLGADSIRIRAGAGTGKTTTIAMVVAGLVNDQGIDPERILGITFTNKAAAELSDRARQALTAHGDDDARQIEVHTYHGFAAQVLSEFAALAGLDRRVRVITPTFSRQLIGERFYNNPYRLLDITSPRNIDKIRQLGDRLGDHLLTPEDIDAPPDDETSEKRLEMLSTLEDYARDKKRLGVVDYGDLVTLSTRLMKEHPALAAEIKARYRVVVLDEYQDTNPAQRVLLTTIFNDGFPVIAVGDEDQTIYEWRGASSENFEQFLEHFPRADGSAAHDLGLTTNRRSAPEILTVANEVRARANASAEDLVADGRIPTGEVITYWGGDAVEEASWLAAKFEELHGLGVSWRAMAILFRKNKDFAVVVEAMREADIPVEVANLGGLLSVPEVAELKAWLTIVESPGNSAALIQILMGSRYRLGLADLAPMSTWVRSVETDDDSDSVVGVSLLEALEHIDQIDIREEAAQAIRHFYGIYRDLLIDCQGASLVETCRLVLDRTRAWQDMEALPDNQRLTARLNIYRILDLAEDWSPLGGRPSLGAFLDYLTAMEDEPAEELDSAHLSGEDAVTLVTIHRAKGLEWDVVAIPAVIDKSFPGRSLQHPDPHRFPEHIPPRYRIDHLLDHLPDDRNERDEFYRQRNALQEWRIAYVATTRARRTLIATGASWYGLPEPNKVASEPSELFDLISDHADENIRPYAEAPPRPEILGVGTIATDADPLFPDGWAGAMRAAIRGEDVISETARKLGVEMEFEKEADRLTDRLFDLARVEDVIEDPDGNVVSVTGLVTYAQCPLRYFWTDIDPLPRRRNPAAISGTELHRRIELFQKGQVPFEEMESDLYDVPDEGTGSGGFGAFRDSRFAQQKTLMVEAPFELDLETGHRLRGRVDAIYADGRHWEIVDFKSGRPNDDRARVVQLEAYAVAARDGDMGHPRPETMDVTFAYLGGGLNEETYRADETWVDRARDHINSLATGISSGDFPPSAGEWCRHCDFLTFCPTGRAEVGT